MLQMHHTHEEIEKALVNLCDRLCQWERSTGRQSVLILKERDFTIRAIDGVRAFAQDKMISDEKLLKLVDEIQTSVQADAKYCDECGNETKSKRLCGLCFSGY